MSNETRRFVVTLGRTVVDCSSLSPEQLELLWMTRMYSTHFVELWVPVCDVNSFWDGTRKTAGGYTTDEVWKQLVGPDGKLKHSGYFTSEALHDFSTSV